MPIRVRKSEERGHGEHGWLDTRHTFSFADYHDSAQMGFRALRVINEDLVAPGAGFPTHGHRDMEILTYVLAGALEHKDSLGSGGVLRPGEVQHMSAGTGITHSESNPSNEVPLHLLQIWIVPERPGLEPEYEQKAFPAAGRRGKFQVFASHDGREGSLRIHQDVSFSGTVIGTGATVRFELAPGRHAWVQVARGAVDLNGTALEQGDGAAVSGERGLVLTTGGVGAEVLVFEMA